MKLLPLIALALSLTGCGEISSDPKPKKEYWIVYTSLRGQYYIDNSPEIMGNGHISFVHNGKFVIATPPYIIEKQ